MSRLRSVTAGLAGATVTDRTSVRPSLRVTLALSLSPTLRLGAFVAGGRLRRRVPGAVAGGSLSGWAGLKIRLSTVSCWTWLRLVPVARAKVSAAWSSRAVSVAGSENVLAWITAGASLPNCWIAIWSEPGSLALRGKVTSTMLACSAAFHLVSVKVPGVDSRRMDWTQALPFEARRTWFSRPAMRGSSAASRQLVLGWFWRRRVGPVKVSNPQEPVMVPVTLGGVGWADGVAMGGVAGGAVSVGVLAVGVLAVGVLAVGVA